MEFNTMLTYLEQAAEQAIAAAGAGPAELADAWQECSAKLRQTASELAACRHAAPPVRAVEIVSSGLVLLQECRQQLRLAIAWQDQAGAAAAAVGQSAVHLVQAAQPLVKEAAQHVAWAEWAAVQYSRSEDIAVQVRLLQRRLAAGK